MRIIRGSCCEIVRNGSSRHSSCAPSLVSCNYVLPSGKTRVRKNAVHGRLFGLKFDLTTNRIMFRGKIMTLRCSYMNSMEEHAPSKANKIDKNMKVYRKCIFMILLLLFLLNYKRNYLLIFWYVVKSVVSQNL